MKDSNFEQKTKLIDYFESNGVHVIVADLDQLAKLPNPGLRSFLSKVWYGNDEIYTTPWIKAKDLGTPESKTKVLKEAQSILKEWMQHLKKLDQPVFETLVKFENDLAEKVGPLSIQKPLTEREGDILAYYTDILNPGSEVSSEAIDATLSEYRKARGTNIRSAEKTLNNMKKSTSSGLPLYTRKRLVASKQLSSKMGHASDGRYHFFYELIDGQMYEICAILGWRGQEGGIDEDDVKQRVVWMFPFKVNIKELQCYQPLIEIFQNFNLMPAYVSSESVDRSITALFDTKEPDELVVCTDFTKFDQHFNQNMQSAARSILSGLLAVNPESKAWLNDIFPIKYNMPLLLNDYGKDKCLVVYGPHGMGSGSGGTNFDESIAHRALQHEAALQNGAVLNPYSMCHGDDGVLSFPGITIEKVTQAYTAHGQDMNLIKQHASAHDCVYLRKWHHDSYRKDGICVGVYSTARALGRLMFQERYMDPDDYPSELDRSKMIALRELSIIENCKHHPLFEEFAEFCMKRDKYRLGLDIPGDFFDNLTKYAKLANDYMPDFLGYTRSLQKGARNVAEGINDWEIVKWLRHQPRINKI